MELQDATCPFDSKLFQFGQQISTVEPLSHVLFWAEDNAEHSKVDLVELPRLQLRLRFRPGPVLEPHESAGNSTGTLVFKKKLYCEAFGGQMYLEAFGVSAIRQLLPNCPYSLPPHCFLLRSEAGDAKACDGRKWPWPCRFHVRRFVTINDVWDVFFVFSEAGRLWLHWVAWRGTDAIKKLLALTFIWISLVKLSSHQQSPMMCLCPRAQIWNAQVCCQLCGFSRVVSCNETMRALRSYCHLCPPITGWDMTNLWLSKWLSTTPLTGRRMPSLQLGSNRARDVGKKEKNRSFSIEFAGQLAKIQWDYKPY